MVRLSEVRQYRADLAAEIERMGRVADASELLADLKVTHCPACDQRIIPYQKPDHCFVCHQHLPEEPEVAGLGKVRLQFEQDRLNAEFLEAAELIAILERDVGKQAKALRDADEALRTIEVELAPARRAVAAIAQADVSAIDMALGKVAERPRPSGSHDPAAGPDCLGGRVSGQWGFSENLHTTYRTATRRLSEAIQ
nr:hypothetical protein [Acetobacter syzygii]